MLNFKICCFNNGNHSMVKIIYFSKILKNAIIKFEFYRFTLSLMERDPIRRNSCIAEA